MTSGSLEARKAKSPEPGKPASLEANEPGRLDARRFPSFQAPGLPGDDLRMPPFDSEKARAFAGRLLGHLNSGAFCLMASIGHRTGLFDAMRDQPPMTSAALASRAGLHERDVRERQVREGLLDRPLAGLQPLQRLRQGRLRLGGSAGCGVASWARSSRASASCCRAFS